jgi:hypothetical protein
MGPLMRRRRPMMRVAGAAVLGTVAYQSGKGHDQQEQGGSESQQAYAATQGPPPDGQPAAAPDTTAELERLAGLHNSGALTDAEFSAAKFQLLGI